MIKLNYPFFRSDSLQVMKDMGGYELNTNLSQLINSFLPLISGYNKVIITSHYLGFPQRLTLKMYMLI